MKKINDILSGIPMTAVGGIFLILSLVLRKAGVDISADPAWVTVVISGIPLVYLAVWRIIHNPGISKISSALLITIAMFAAIAVDDLFAAGEVAFIMAVGAILEDMTTNRAKKGLKQLISLAPVRGRKLENGKEIMISADEIRVNDILRSLPGETIPADGVIISGETSVDQSVMTGEALPVDKVPGDHVFCGTVNCFGAVDIRALRDGKDASLQKLIRMVQQAEDKKAPMARIADKAASWLVPAALLIAAAALIVTKDINRAVTVLVVFCPCALVLATPTTIMAAIGQAASRGVIIKSGEALEKMGKVNTAAFDKTGTLTCGRLEVSDIISFDRSIDENGLLSLAASAESKSGHPLGKAIFEYADSKSVSLCECNNFRMFAGKGVYAEIKEKKLYCGNERFLTENGIRVSEEAKYKLESLRLQGKASVIVADEKNVKGIIALSDVLRPEAAEVVGSLAGMNTKSVLLTGDNKTSANYFAAQTGIENVCAELLPEEKVENIKLLQDSGKIVCMIGDGINDAPALKAADVGIAMGDMGSDISVESADIVLMNDDISRLPYLKRLSNAAIHTIKLAITLSMCINFVAVTLSVLGVLDPTTGALVHNAGSCLVVLIAALLYDRKFD